MGFLLSIWVVFVIAVRGANPAIGLPEQRKHRLVLIEDVIHYVGVLGVCEDDSLLGTATKMQGRCLNVHKPVGQKNPKAGRC